MSRISFTLSSRLASSSSDIPPCSSTRPSLSLLSLSSWSSLSPLSSPVSLVFDGPSSSSSSRSSNIAASSFAASLRILPPFAFGTSNWQRTLLAMRLRIWVKHQVWFVAPGNVSMWVARWLIILLLFNALSQVMPNIWQNKVCISIYNFDDNRTLSLTPKSSRTSANAAARFSPKCDFATSTRSRSMDIGSPSCVKWTVNAT